MGGGEHDGKLGTTACAFQEGFNFPLQIKKVPQRPRILMWVLCGVKGFSEIEAIGTLFFEFTVSYIEVSCCDVHETKLINIILASLCFWTVFRVAFSTCWSVMDNRLFGRIFCRDLGPLPNMGKLLFSFSSKMSGNVITRDSG